MAGGTLREWFRQGAAAKRIRRNPNMAPRKKVSQTVLTEGKFYTISAANGKVVEVADYNIDNGAKIQLWDNVNAEWQQWNFVPAGDGVYRIQNRFTQKMLDLDCGGVSDG